MYLTAQDSWCGRSDNSRHVETVRLSLFLVNCQFQSLKISKYNRVSKEKSFCERQLDPTTARTHRTTTEQTTTTRRCASNNHSRLHSPNLPFKFFAVVALTPTSWKTLNNTSKLSYLTTKERSQCPVFFNFMQRLVYGSVTVSVHARAHNHQRYPPPRLLLLSIHCVLLSVFPVVSEETSARGLDFGEHFGDPSKRFIYSILMASVLDSSDTFHASDYPRKRAHPLQPHVIAITLTEAQQLQRLTQQQNKLLY
eukprot:gene8669-1062_t